jgi:hypothetical protein
MDDYVSIEVAGKVTYNVTTFLATNVLPSEYKYVEECPSFIPSPHHQYFFFNP